MAIHIGTHQLEDMIVVTRCLLKLIPEIQPQQPPPSKASKLLVEPDTPTASRMYQYGKEGGSEEDSFISTLPAMVKFFSTRNEGLFGEEYALDESSAKIMRLNFFVGEFNLFLRDTESEFLGVIFCFIPNSVSDSVQVHFNSLDCAVDQNTKNMEFEGKLKSLAIQNLMTTGSASSDPVYFLKSRESEDMMNIKFSFVDASSKQLYKNGASLFPF
jgi:hypothetical protein